MAALRMGRAILTMGIGVIVAATAPAHAQGEPPTPDPAPPSTATPAAPVAPPPARTAVPSAPPASVPTTPPPPAATRQAPPAPRAPKAPLEAKPPPIPMAPAVPHYLRPRDAPNDSKRAAGVLLAGIGGLFIAGGIGIYVDADTPSRECFGPTPDSCFTPRRDLDAGAGIAMIVGGTGALLMGAGTIHASMSEKYRYPRNNDTMMGAGIVMTGIGAAGVVGSGALWFFGWTEDRDALGAAAIMYHFSGAILGIGYGLWLKGAKTPNKNSSELLDASERQRAETILRSPAMLYAGLGMATAGVGLMAGTFALAASDDDDNEAVLIIPPAFFAGGLLIGLGIPLAVIGGTDVKPIEAFGNLLPDIQFSPTGGALRWTY